jgi:RNA polymerase sigma factor (sigma-70 family)
VKRARKMDAGHRALADAYRPRAVRLGLAFARRFRHEADDLIQAGLLGLCIAATKCPDPAAALPGAPAARRFAAFAHRAVTWAILDELNAHRRRVARHNLERPELIAAAAASEDDERLHAALAALPEPEREATIRLLAYGESQSEAARAMGCSRDGVLGPARRGLARLRASLRESSVISH